MPALPPLSPSQLQATDLLMADCGMPFDVAAEVARNFRGNEAAGPSAIDDPLIEYARIVAGWGVPTSEIAGWMAASGQGWDKRTHYRLDYTSEQYELAHPVLEALHETGIELTEKTPNDVRRWHSLARTVPPDFLALCIRAGVTDGDEIAKFDARRAADDPGVRSELSLLAGLLADT